MRNILKITCFFLLIGANLSAQRGAEFGFRAGVSHYFGDLNPDIGITDLGLNLGFKARRNFNDRLSFSLGIDYAKVSGSDTNALNAFERARNLSFSSNVLDASLTFEFNFFPYIHGSSDYPYTPYIFGGFSMMRYNPKAELNGQTYALRDLGTEGQSVGGEYFLLTSTFAYGFGFKFDLNIDFSINVEFSGRRLFSDYIDDVSQSYPDYGNLRSLRGDIAVDLANRSEDIDFGRTDTQRGNGRSNDTVFFLSIGIMKYVGKLRCPPISKSLMDE